MASARKKKSNSRENSGEEQPNQPKRTLGGLFKLGYLKAASKMGFIDKTSIEPSFDRNMCQLENYHTSVRQMYYGCERMMQPNPLLLQEMLVQERTPSDNPHVRLVTFFDNMKTVGTLNPNAGADRCLLSFLNKQEVEMVNSIVKLGKELWKKEYQSREQVVVYMRETCEFLYKFEKEYKEKRVLMKDLLLAMDDGGNQIRKAKTNEDLEKIGPDYESVVNVYNRNAIEITDNWIYNYPKFNFLHQRDLVKFHMSRATYHREAAKVIREWIKRENYNEVRSAYDDRGKKQAVGKKTREKASIQDNVEKTQIISKPSTD